MMSKYSDAIGQGSGLNSALSSLVAQYARECSCINDIYDASYPSEDRGTCVRIFLGSLASLIDNNRFFTRFINNEWSFDQEGRAKQKILSEWQHEALGMAGATQQKLSDFVLGLFLPLRRFRDGNIEVHLPLVVIIRQRFDSIPICSLEKALDTSGVKFFHGEAGEDLFNLDYTAPPRKEKIWSKMDSLCLGELTRFNQVSIEYMFELFCCRLGYIAEPEIGKVADKLEQEENKADR